MCFGEFVTIYMRCCQRVGVYSVCVRGRIVRMFEPRHGWFGVRVLRRCTRSNMPPRVAIAGCCLDYVGGDLYTVARTQAPYGVRSLC